MLTYNIVYGSTENCFYGKFWFFSINCSANFLKFCKLEICMKKTVSNSCKDLQCPALNGISILLFVAKKCHFILRIGYETVEKVQNHGCN